MLLTPLLNAYKASDDQNTAQILINKYIQHICEGDGNTFTFLFCKWYKNDLAWNDESTLSYLHVDTFYWRVNSSSNFGVISDSEPFPFHMSAHNLIPVLGSAVNFIWQA